MDEQTSKTTGPDTSGPPLPSDLDPADAVREKVAKMSAKGLPEAQIALYLGISLKKLRKHFHKELTEPAAEANLAVLEALFDMASSRCYGPATIFWARSRCGFRSPSPDPQSPRPSKTAPPPPNPPPDGITVHLNDGEPNFDA